VLIESMGRYTNGVDKEDVGEKISASEWIGQYINVAARSAEDRKRWKDVMHVADPSTGGWH